MDLIRSARHSGQAAERDLRDALSEFRKLLSPSESAVLDTSIASKSLEGNCVVALTRQIEDTVASRKSRRYSARLQKFLDAVNDFTNIIDAIVAFGPSIAATTWGVVKVTLLLACNAASYVENVVAMFKEIGDCSPIYDEYATLFPDSAPLQNALCGYFVHVIRFCGAVVKIVRGSSTKLLFGATLRPFEAQFGSVKEDLRSASRKVRSEIELAAHKMQQEEIEHSSRFRRMQQAFGANTTRHLADSQAMHVASQAGRKARTIKRIKRLLQPLDHRDAHMRIYKKTTPGSALWLQTMPEFCSWYESDQKTALLLSGTMGSGKSVVTANIVQYLIQYRAQGTHIAHCFCDDSVPDSLRANIVLKSLIGQLICNSLEFLTQDGLDTIDEMAAGPDLGFNLSELVSYVPRTKSHYIIIDNFDYCETPDRDAILNVLRRLYETGLFKVLLTTRTARASQPQATHPPWTHVIHITQRLTEGDMRVFVQSSLDDKLETGDLCLANPELISPIYEHLLTGAEGMFLWAHLMLEELPFCESDSVIVEILESPPWELSKLFASMLQRVSQSPESPLMRNLLAWILGARRALTVPELCEALAIRAGQPHLEKRLSPRTVITAIMATRGLILFDEDDSTVRPVHNSFRCFLLEPANVLNRTDMKYSEHALQAQLTGLCLTYLTTDAIVMPVAKRSPSDNLSSHFRAVPIASQSAVKRDRSRIARAILHGRQIPDRATAWAQQTWSSPQQINTALSQFGSRIIVHGNTTDVLADHCLLKYAQENWSAHAANLEPETDSTAWTLLKKVYLGRYQHIPQPWHEMSSDDLPPDWLRWLRWQPLLRAELAALYWAVANGHLAIARVAMHDYLHSGKPPDPLFAGEEQQMALVAKTFLRPINPQMADLVCSLWRLDTLTWPVAPAVCLWLSVRFDLDQYVEDFNLGLRYIGAPTLGHGDGPEALFDFIDDREKHAIKILRTNYQGLTDIDIAVACPLSLVQLCIAYGSRRSLRKLLDVALGGGPTGRKETLSDAVLIALLYNQHWFLNDVLAWSTTILDTQAAVMPSLVHLAAYKGRLDVAAFLALLSPEFWQMPLPPAIYCALLHMSLRDAGRWEYLVQRTTVNDPDVRSTVLQRISQYARLGNQHDLSGIETWTGGARDDYVVYRVRAANLHSLGEDFAVPKDLAQSMKRSRSTGDLRR